MARDDGIGPFFAGFMLGGLVGAALALLFAPQPGEETVAMIKTKGIELKERVTELTPEELKKAAQEGLEKGKEVAARTGERARKEAARVKEGAARAKGEVLSKLEHWSR